MKPIQMHDTLAAIADTLEDIQFGKIVKHLRECRDAIDLNDPAGAEKAGRGRRRRKYAPRTSTPMTKLLARKIHACVMANPHVTLMSIAEKFNVHSSRVTEVLRGHYR